MLNLTSLSEKEIKDLHQATLRILSQVGVTMTHEKAREILSGAGAKVEGDRVHFPPDLVLNEVARCPSQVSVRGRGGDTVVLGDGSLHWHNVGGARSVFEPRTGECRDSTLQDVCDSALVLDALDHATSITPFFTPRDIEGELMSLAMYRHSLPHTTKPVQGPGILTGKEVKIAVKMASVLGPPAEVLSLAVSPVSPLLFSDNVTGAIIEIARQGIPFTPLPCPTAGTTAPFSIAGAVAQQNAENLASIVLAQVVHPGLPIVYCGRLAMMEPRTGISVWGGVELGMASAATVQLGHHYDLPVNVYGFSTNSQVLDIQNGWERALNAAIPALAGADELSGIGEMEAGVMGSYAQMVCDDEIAASVERLRRGFAVDEDSLAVEVIGKVMDGQKNFLGQPHTSQYMRGGEILFTTLAERRPWEIWEREGREGMVERAQSEAERIIAEHEVEPLSPAQERELDAIMQEARRKLVAH